MSAVPLAWTITSPSLSIASSCEDAWQHISTECPHRPSALRCSLDEALMATSIARAELTVMKSGFHLDRVTANAKSSGSGNCKEMSMVAFTFLRKQLGGSAPLELMGVNSPVYGMHMFVAIGRVFAWPVLAGAESVPTAAGVPANWGNDVVICDPSLVACATANIAGGQDNAYALNATSLMRLGMSRAAEV